MAWLTLVVAGCFEVGFTTMMKLSQGFTRPGPSFGFFVFAILSFVLLNRAIKSIEIGTAYAVWTGIGAAGTVIVGIIFFGESASAPRMLLLALLIGAAIGLKFVPSKPAAAPVPAGLSP